MIIQPHHPQIVRAASSEYHERPKTIEDIAEIRHIDREENEFAYSFHLIQTRHIFNIYFRWKQQNRVKPTHSNNDDNSTLNMELKDLLNPTRYLDNLSYRSSSLLPQISLHNHRTRSSSRRQTIASTNSLLLNSPPRSPPDSPQTNITKNAEKFDKDENDDDDDYEHLRKNEKQE